MLNQIATDYHDERPGRTALAQEHAASSKRTGPTSCWSYKSPAAWTAISLRWGTRQRDVEPRDVATAQQQGAPEAAYQERVRALQNRQQEMEEVIRHDLILQPLAD